METLLTHSLGTQIAALTPEPGTVFCLGLDSMGFRSWCEDTIRALAESAQGASEWTRPPLPERGFPD
jgi:hypothetical protein